MEVGLAAKSSGFIPFARRRHREGEARVGYRPNHAEALAFTPCKRVSRALCSRLSGFLSLAGIAKVAHAFGAGIRVRYVDPALFINSSVPISPNKAFKHARFTRWDALSARPLISR